MKCRLWIAVIILAILPITVFGAAQGGYIRLIMTYDGAPVAGGTVTLYDVSDSSDDVTPDVLAQRMNQRRITGLTKQVNHEGVVVFEDVPIGRYLLAQQEAADGFYPMKPFYVQVDGYAQQIDARPKLQRMNKLPQTGQLIWPVWVLFGVGGLLIGTGLICRKREQ